MKELIAICGLDCETCEARIATVNNDDALREQVARKWAELEKAREFDPSGHAGLTPMGEIRLTLAGEIKMTPVEVSAGEFFCRFETPCPGTAGINLKNYTI